MRNRILLACLVLSGFAGVAYELLWVRQLTFAFGSTTASFATVLAVFFGGMALGAAVGARSLRWIRRPVLAYGLIELGTAALALVVNWALPKLCVLVALLDPGPGWPGTALRLGLATLVLLPPTLLMGMTLPCVCRAMIVKDEEMGRGTALIYGLNTFGAFLGAYLVTYHLLPAFGVGHSMLGTICINSLAGLIACGWSSYRPTVVTPEGPAEPSPSAQIAEQVPLALALTFLSGFSFIALEVIWGRIFAVLLGGSVYGIGAVLISVLIAIAAGSLLAGLLFRAKVNLAMAFVLLQAAQLASIVLLLRALPLVTYGLTTLAEISSGPDPVFTQLFGVIAVLALPALTAGTSFPILIRLAESRAAQSGQALGRLYAANTVGSIIGSLLTGLVLLPSYGSNAAVFIALLAISAAVGLGATALKGRRFVGWAAVVASLALTLTFDGYNSEATTIARGMGHHSFADVDRAVDLQLKQSVFFSEGETANVLVQHSVNGLSLSLNGLGQGGRNYLPPRTVLESLLVAAFPLVHVDSPANALVVGLGAGVTVSALHRLQVPRVKVIELEPKVVDAVDRIFEGDSPVGQPGVEVEINDARHFLLVNGRPQGERFDLITSMPAHPWVAANIFTQEFFQLAKSNLAPRGVFSTWFGIGSMDDMVIQSLFQAFTAVFDNYFVYFVPEAGAFYLVGANAPLSFDVAHLAKLQASPLFKEHPELRERNFFASRVFASADAATPKPEFAPANTDDSAFIETRAPRRQAKSFDAKKLAAYFPGPYLLPRLLKVEQPAHYLSEALESTLSELADLREEGMGAIRFAQVASAVAGLGQDLGPGVASYLAGRLARLRGETANAKTRLDEAAAVGGDVEGKARLEAALLLPVGGRARLAALAALPYSNAAALELAAENPNEVGAFLAKAPATAAPDDLRWVLAAASRGTLTVDEARLFAERVPPLLQDRPKLGLVRVASELATKAGIQPLAAILQQYESMLRSARAAAALGGAEKAYREKDYQRAAEGFERVRAATPTELEPLKKLYHSYRKLGLAAQLAGLKDHLRLLGKSDDWFAALDAFLDKVDTEQAHGLSVPEEAPNRAPPTQAPSPTP